MKLKDLRAKGAFVTAGPVRKEIEWRHFDEASGELVTDKFFVHVRRHSFGTISRAMATDSADKKAPDDKSVEAPDLSRTPSEMLIATSILLGEQANEVMSPADASNLDPGLATAFIRAINQVNGLSEKVEAKNSPPSTSSGTT